MAKISNTPFNELAFSDLGSQNKLTTTEIKAIKLQAEKEIYEIVVKLEKETGLEVESITKKTTHGGRLDPWYTMYIKLIFP